ncbi:hypothetical protein V1264_002819 [Littorina saxatilis]|uniref:C2H2-type domain-containing protein n=2 Tax=Littorina saxatilis TaxID=31220 RepID=A0AAN9G7W0_9CAEN
MSHEGGRNRGKDGGAQNIPHESSFHDGILYLSKDSPSAEVREIADANSLQLVQDGGTISLLSGDGEDMSVDMYAYDQSVSENAAEWMKTKCKSLSIDFDGVGEENVGDILGLGSESKVDNLMVMGGQFLSSEISEDSGIILCSDGVNLVTSGISSGNDAKCSDIIPLCNLPDDLSARTDQVLCPAPSSQNSTNSLLDSSSATVTGFSDMPHTLDTSNITFTAFTDRVIQKFEPVEDLVQSNQTTILETSFPSLATSQSLMGVSSATSVASSVSLSDSGLPGILPNFLGIDSLSSPGNELGILQESSSGSMGEGLQQNGFLATEDGTELTTSSAASDDSRSIDLSDPSNVTLAMISVSTDKDANSTQIVVNTSQGQRFYMINTASLNQAKGVAHPITVEGTSGVDGVATFHTSGAQNLFTVPVSNLLMCSEAGCGKTFTKLSKLKIHAMLHTGERPFKCTRYGCDWAFTTSYKLKRHEESHGGKKDFYCDIAGCNRKFTTIYNLKTHQRLHTRPCTEKCPEEGCEARFPTKRHLEAHLRSHFGDEKRYQCPYPGCTAVFFSAMSMGSHARIHKERDEDLRCNYEGCGKVFDRLCRLKQHVRQHTGEKPYKCEYEGCTWAFTTASKLKRHSAKHLNLRKYKCTQCGKGFMRPEHLKGHLVTHTGVKPFTCPVEGCEANFTAKSSLYVHLSKHNKGGGKMVFRCPIDHCTSKYSTKALLRTHMLKHLINSPDADQAGREMAQMLMGCMSDSEEQEKAVGDVNGTGEEDEEGCQLEEGGVEISPDQLTGAAVTQLLSSPVTIDAQSPGTSQPTISLESPVSRAVYLKNRSGCARTDFQSNHLIANQARQRWHQQRDDASQANSSLETDASPVQSVASTDAMLGLVKQETETYATSESTLSGLTFRDPETGLTYVQTQLLQDDPPHTVYYSSDPMGLSGDTSDVNQTMLDMVPSHFSNTTINLNDLV